MNERIKELAKQSGAMFDHMTWVERDLAPVFERFAELIVRECVGVVEGGRFLHDQAPTAIFAKECSDAIKRHFGVEE